MGAYTCEFGVVHKVCRCPTPHTIKCDVPGQHAAKTGPERLCLVMEMRLDGRLYMPKHMRLHIPHDWWGVKGGHQVDEAPRPGDFEYPGKKWFCPGWKP